ncbi:hypothetical protein KO494_12790 [Lacinutrix sp. C3R15]|uniref:hypothetical protein n=1 Tax=Flavobacteriaceae TaxID=49546 RepID=UPI001C091364|nr:MULTISPECIES: hypothetical protein [Flavobacteriaceae]MBU2940416.1 hypothetical protein [Lacinutrix sp. C3R15]MDO6623736.1 hypothetical protein [Oceanihabitans sp. 1_MG-2023]
MNSRIKLFLLVILCAAQFSCKNDDSTSSIDNDFIGEWLRSDFTSNFEYKLYFNQNHTGSIINQVTTQDGIISNINSIEWNITNDLLTITQDEIVTLTTYVFTPNGNLVLANFSDFEFIKQ